MLMALAGLLAQMGPTGSGSGGYQLVAAPAVIVTPAALGGPCVATVSGGTGAYTYQWSFKTGGAGIVIDTPTAASTTFSCFGTTERDGTAICTVTDSLGAIAISNDVLVVLISDDGGR